MSASGRTGESWYNNGNNDDAVDAYEGSGTVWYDMSGQPYGTTPTPDIIDACVSPDVTVTVNDEMDASPGRVTVEVHVPSMPWSVQQEMDELLARCREAEAQSSIGPWSQANTASVSSTAKRPDMVYFLTILEQRVALAVPSPPSPPSPRSPSRPRRPRPRRAGYALNFHCSRQEARIEEEVSQQMHAENASPPSPRVEVDEQPKNWAPPHFLERLRPEACSWSPLRSRTSSPKITPAGTTSTWMGSDPPGTASSATSEAIVQSEGLDMQDAGHLQSPKKRGLLELPTAKNRRRRERSKPRPVLIFPMKEQRVRKPMSPALRPKGKVLWLPPLRQVPAPHFSVLPVDRRNRAAPPPAAPEPGEDSLATATGSLGSGAGSSSELGPK